MHTHIDEIAPDVFRLSTFVPEVAAPAGFTFNQFLIRGEEPFLFHTGMRQLFPLVSEAVGRIIPLESLRWISFAHVEADELGAMNLFLAAAPRAEVVHGELACMLSLNDLSDRPPRPLVDGESIDLGGRSMQYIATPHVPHNWESGHFFEQVTGTLFAGDVGATVGDGAPLTTDDIVDGALDAEGAFRGTSLGPMVGATLRRFAALQPSTLTIMHGSSFAGDGADVLERLADGYDHLSLEYADHTGAARA